MKAAMAACRSLILVGRSDQATICDEMYEKNRNAIPYEVLCVATLAGIELLSCNELLSCYKDISFRYACWYKAIPVKTT